MFLHHSIARVRVVSLTKRAPREGEKERRWERERERVRALHMSRGLLWIEVLLKCREEDSLYRFLERVRVRKDHDYHNSWLMN